MERGKPRPAPSRPGHADDHGAARLKLIAADLSTKEIAAQLSVSPRTVETYRQNIGGKLNVRGSLALVRFALQHRAQL